MFCPPRFKFNKAGFIRVLLSAKVAPSNRAFNYHPINLTSIKNNIVKPLFRVLLITSLLVQTLGGVAYARPAESSKLLPTQTARSQEVEPPDGEAPPVEDPEPAQPDEIEEIPALPVSAHFAIGREILLNNQETELTIEVWRVSDVETKGIPVELSLPPELKIVGGRPQTEWILPQLEYGDKFAQTITVKPANQNIDASVVDAVLTVNGGEKNAMSKRVEIGVLPKLNTFVNKDKAETTQGDLGTILDAEEGEVMLLVPDGAVPKGTKLSFNRVKRKELVPESAVDAPSSVEPTEGEPQVADDEDEKSYHQWEFTADQDGRAISNFDKPLFLIYKMDRIKELGVQPELLSLFSRKTESDPWLSVPSRYDDKRNVLVAKLSHFSGYKLALDLDVKGDILPSIGGFSTDLQTGAAIVNYPIEAPAGPGGMTPNLSLNYSSNGVNDFYHANGYSASSNDWDVQASNVGIGWNLGGISYIAITDQWDAETRWDNHYSLVLNGASTKMRHANPGGSSPVIMESEQFIKIDQNLVTWDSARSTRGKVVDTGNWIVTSQDGTKHTFGSFPSVDPRPDPGSTDQTVNPLASDSPQSMVINLTKDHWQVNKWYLRESVDTQGNYISYAYHSDQRRLRPNSGNQCTTDSAMNQASYYTHIRPNVIQWGGNKQTGEGHTMQLYFNYNPRQDIRSNVHLPGNPIANNKDWALARCIQYTYSTQLLNYIAVQVKVGGTFKTIRRYDLNYGYTNPSGVDWYIKHLKLNEIKHEGASPSGSLSVLNTYTFGYQQLTPHAQVYLNTANNGWGGKTTYNYQLASTTEYEISDDNPNTIIDTDTKNYRQRVHRVKVEDGVGNYFWTRYYSNNSRQRLYRDAVEYLGHNYVASYTFTKNKPYSDTASNTTNEVMRTQHWFRQLDGQGGGDPDPRVGRVYAVNIWQKKASLGGSCGQRIEESGRCRMQRIHTTWTALTGSGTSWTSTSNYHAYPRWVRQDQVIVSQEHSQQSPGYVNSTTKYFYNADEQHNEQFGQITKVEEHTGSALERTTITEYYPNTSTHIVNKPARITVEDENENCVAESRNIYDGTGRNYDQSPSEGLLTKTEVLLNGNCTTTASIGTYNNNWAITHYSHDNYGNVTLETRKGPNSSTRDIKIRTTYDGTYNIFPISVRNDRETTLVETAKYYGVNYSSTTAGSRWGAMAEQCAVNDVCSRLAYDNFGRPTYRWERVLEGSGWEGTSAAETKWEYTNYGTSGSKTTVIKESHAPHECGTFVRRHYNGLGQLVKEQRPDQFWAADNNNCIAYTPSSGHIDQEIDVGYRYDSLGNQIEASVPERIKDNWFNRPIDWNLPTTVTTYDVLGRPMLVTLPNGEQQEYEYEGRVSKITGLGQNGDPNKLLKYTEVDGLGYLKYVRSAEPNGTNQNRVKLEHDVVGNLTCVWHEGVSSSSCYNNGAARMTYDKGGRKLTMNDPHLGNWSYSYDRLGNLTQQTDANGNVTALTYDGETNRLVQKTLNGGGSQYFITYHYDTALNSNSTCVGNRCRGQLTYTGYSDGRYSKYLSYHANGLLSRERVQIVGAPSGNYDTDYEYDSYHRQYKTTYPDGDIVTTPEYNSMGLPRGLHSTTEGTLVDGAWYHETGDISYYRMPRGLVRYYRQFRHSWADDNRRIDEIRVGTAVDPNTAGSYNKIQLLYTYDSFGNIKTLGERYNNASSPINHTFGYDAQNRLTFAFGESYSYAADGEFTNFEGKNFTYNAWRRNAVNLVDGVDRYDYDANGNMVARRKGAGEQTLTWNPENRLQKVTQGTSVEEYIYDPDGIRVKWKDNSSELYFINAFYEVGNALSNVTSASAEGSVKLVPGPDENNSTQLFLPMAIGNDSQALSTQEAESHHVLTPEEEMEWQEQKDWDAANPDDDPAQDPNQVAAAAASSSFVFRHYYFNGQRVAVRNGFLGSFYFLHNDHLNSVVLSTDWNVNINYQKYYAYGSPRSYGGGILPSYYRFTGQILDPSGLYYYNARYYDPEIGQFVSPDTIVPDPTSLLDYNRYMYGLGNPVRNVDPNGHDNCDVTGNHNCVGSQNELYYNPAVSAPEDDVAWQNAAASGYTYDEYLAGRHQYFSYINYPHKYYADDELSYRGSDAALRRLGAAQGYAEYAAHTNLQNDVAVAAGIILAVVFGGGNQTPVQVGEAGSYGRLQARSVTGDRIALHHMPAKSYGYTSPNSGGALAMHDYEHALTRTYKGRAVSALRADQGLSFRQVLAKDIMDVRNIVGSKYNGGLRGLIRYYRQNYPGLMSKK